MDCEKQVSFYFESIHPDIPQCARTIIIVEYVSHFLPRLMSTQISPGCVTNLQGNWQIDRIESFCRHLIFIVVDFFVYI